MCPLREGCPSPPPPFPSPFLARRARAVSRRVARVPPLSVSSDSVDTNSVGNKSLEMEGRLFTDVVALADRGRFGNFLGEASTSGIPQSLPVTLVCGHRAPEALHSTRRTPRSRRRVTRDTIHQTTRASPDY